MGFGFVIVLVSASGGEFVVLSVVVGAGEERGEERKCAGE